jgi:hypothetical protein
MAISLADVGLLTKIKTRIYNFVSEAPVAELSLA